MSQATNVDLVRRAIEAAIRRPPDLPTVNSLFDPEHELLQLTHGPESRTPHVGAVGFRDRRAQMDQAGAWRVEIDDAIAASDVRVVVLLRFLLRGERSRAQVEQRLGLLVTLRDGKLTRTETFPAWQDALAAAGLSV
jgi:ketosteroid isomerase-like protein